MALFPPQRSRSFDAIYAVVVACLLAVQGLNYAAFVHGPGASLSGATVAVDADVCSKAAEGGDDHAPSPQGRHNHDHCWTKCCQGGRQESYFAFIERWSLAAFLLLPTAEGAGEEVPPPFANDPPRLQTGWASTWSSRAPPFFND
jgi:hypothetical protein